MMDQISYKSHTIHLANNISYFYTDSGSPMTDDYTTFLFIHGTGFTGHTFTRLHPFAAAYNLRTVSLNRRDYPGSTPFTQAEVEGWNTGRLEAWEKLGFQLAEFILKFVEQSRIPKIHKGNAEGKAGRQEKMGGLVVVGWSMGVCTALALFLPVVKEKLGDRYQVLKEYLRDLVMFDPPIVALGHPIAADTDFAAVHLPWTRYNDKLETAEETMRKFAEWVSSYYDFPRDPASINDLKQARLQRAKKSTVDSLGEVEYKQWIDVQAAVRTETLAHTTQDTISHVTSAALFSSSPTFPDVNVVYIAPTRGPWICYWTSWEHKRIYSERLKNGQPARKTSFVEIQGGNHIVHWDMPELFIDSVLAGLHCRGEDEVGWIRKGKSEAVEYRSNL